MADSNKQTGFKPYVSADTQMKEFTFKAVFVGAILSIILGGVAGLGVAFFSEYCDHRFNNPEDLKKHLGTPVLASIHEME